MHIAILSDGVHPYVVGGMQKHTYYLCKYLAKENIRITLIHFNRSNLDISRLEVFSSDERRYIESIVINFPDEDRFPGHYLRSSYKYSCLAYHAIHQRLKEFDFIYTKGFSGWKLLEEKCLNPDKFPAVGINFHGYEMFQKQADLRSRAASIMLKNPVRKLTRMADVVFSYGAGISGIIRKLGIPSDRIAEIPAGIETEWLRKTPVSTNSERRTFVYLGRFERRKGTEELAIVLPDLLKDERVIFSFIGPIPDDRKIVHPRVNYYGTVTDRDELIRLLDSTDFLVCPSWSEGMPNVILEAMSRGCAIIASKVGAVSDMVDERNGYTLHPGNVEDLKSCMLEAAQQSQDSLLSMKKASMNKIEHEFLYSHIIQKLLQTISKYKKQIV